jgi:hypothetical protein
MKNVRETRREYSRMDNPGTQVTLGKKQIMKTNKTKNTENKKMSNKVLAKGNPASYNTLAVILVLK